MNITEVKWYVYDKNLIFILTAKNAHHTMERVLIKELGWVFSINLHEKKLETSDTEYLGIIRHPIDRWISGISQYYFNENNIKIDHPLIKETSIDDLIEKKWLDGHSSPQSYIYDQFRPLKLFRLEDIDKLWDYLRNKGYKDFTTNFHINSYKEQTEKAMFYNFLKEELDNNPQYVNRLLHIFKDDLKYYNDCYKEDVFI